MLENYKRNWQNKLFLIDWNYPFRFIKSAEIHEPFSSHIKSTGTIFIFTITFSYLATKYYKYVHL